MHLLVEAPINSLSLGNVSYNFLRELKNKKVDIGLWPVGEIDVKAYPEDKELLEYIQLAINNRYNYLKEDAPSFKVWHLNGSENRKTSKQFLITLDSN